MLYIGLDLGTSACKLLLVDGGGAVLNEMTKEYPLEFPHHGWSEQDPQDWWRAITEGVPELLAGFDPSQVAGIGAGGQMHGLVALDEHDNVIRPAILWNDGRTAKEVDYLPEGRRRFCWSSSSLHTDCSHDWWKTLWDPRNSVLYSANGGCYRTGQRGYGAETEKQQKSITISKSERKFDMKKISKAILVGTGIAAVGLLVYSLRKDTEKPVSVWSSDAKPATSPSKEYVEHRRQQIRDAAEAKRAAQQETAMSSPEEEIPQDGEPLHETGEKPEESSTTIAEQNAVPAEPTPLVQAEEQQKEI